VVVLEVVDIVGLVEAAAVTWWGNEGAMVVETILNVSW